MQPTYMYYVFCAHSTHCTNIMHTHTYHTHAHHTHSNILYICGAFDLLLIFLCSLIQALTLTPPPNNANMDMWGSNIMLTCHIHTTSRSHHTLHAHVHQHLYTHFHTHTHYLTLAHTLSMDVYTNMYTHTFIHIHTTSHSHTHSPCTCTLTCIHTLTHSNTLPHTRTHTLHAHVHQHVYTHLHTQTHYFTLAHSHTHSPCTCTPTCIHTLTHSNTLQISYGSSSPTLSDRDMFPKFFRTIPSETQSNSARFALMQRYNWTKVATLHETRNVFTLVSNQSSLYGWAHSILPETGTVSDPAVGSFCKENISF